MTIQSKRLTGILLTVVIILCIPLIAMQFTDVVVWDLFDFTVMGGLLLGTGLLCELTLRKIKHKDYRLGIVAIILIVLFLVGAELAVGIFGTPFAGN